VKPGARTSCVDRAGDCTAGPETTTAAARADGDAHHGGL